MAHGKAISQAGHAFLGSFLKAQQQTPDVTTAYATESPGTKVCLQGDLNSILRSAQEAEEAGVPHFLVVDSGCENFFDGQPTVTALGVGPITKNQAHKITGRFQLL